MAAKCLQNIISIKVCEDDADSLSGYDIFDLPGISLKKAANAADAQYTSGLKLLKAKRRLAILDIKNELITYLQAKNYVVNSIDSFFRTGDLRIGDQSKLIPATGDGSQYRGNVVYSKRTDCLLRKLFISNVYIKSNYTGETTLRIEDGNTNHDFSVDLVAGKIMEIEVNYTAESHEVKLMLPTNVVVYSTKPNCGCDGNSNDCAKTLGYSNGLTTKEESYGIIADVQCICDYDVLLCQLAKNSMFGKIVLYYTGAKVMDEITKTDRLNYLTTYGKKEAEATRAEWMAEYGDGWNALIESLRRVIPNIDRCNCLDCNGVAIKSNV